LVEEADLKDAGVPRKIRKLSAFVSGFALNAGSNEMDS
jgi:hypothetical protein